MIKNMIFTSCIFLAVFPSIGNTFAIGCVIDETDDQREEILSPGTAVKQKIIAYCDEGRYRIEFNNTGINTVTSATEHFALSCPMIKAPHKTIDLYGIRGGWSLGFGVYGGTYVGHRAGACQLNGVNNGFGPHLTGSHIRITPIVKDEPQDYSEGVAP